MSLHRIHFGLAALLSVVLSGSLAYSQDHELRGMQLFEESDVRPYGNWAQPKDGFFFTFDGIYWYLTRPNKTTIGVPHLTRNVFFGPLETDQVVETNTLNTGDFRAKWKQGDRIELGFISGQHGLMVSTFELNRQTQHIEAQNVSVVFNDPAFGPQGSHLLEGIVGQVVDPISGQVVNVVANVPITFTDLQVQNRVKTQGFEVLYMYRPHQLHHGGNLEFLLGGRYLYFDDDFSAFGFGGNLANSSWETDAKNYIAGPEIGVRWSHPIGRFSLSAEGRFTAGINSQNVRQRGLLATALSAPNPQPQPTLMSATGFENSQHFYEFAPVVELRAEGHVQVTRIISLKAGYNMVFMDGIARGSNMTDYMVPTMGITTAHDANKQYVLMHGLNLGIEINR
jgi:hypothetical protein